MGFLPRPAVKSAVISKIRFAAVGELLDGGQGECFFFGWKPGALARNRGPTSVARVACLRGPQSGANEV